MGVGSWLTILLVVGLVGWILWTMPIGQRVANRLGLVGFRRQGAPGADREFLLRACGGDRARVQEMLERARAGDREMSDAEAHRRAIRTVMRTKHGGKVA
jgi:hypothetical protein